MILQQVILVSLKIYRKCISPGLPKACRFTPTCSEYAIQVIEKYGFTSGSIRALKRLLKCHPFNVGGYDPVP